MTHDEVCQLINKLKENYNEEPIILLDGSLSKLREIDLKISAEIFHELGLIYMDLERKLDKLQVTQEMDKDLNKIRLIQSAALLMASQVRNFNQVVNNDLENLWCLVLRKAKVPINSITLSEISKQLYKDVKYMRLRTKRRINQLPVIEFCLPIEEMRHIEIEKIENIISIQEELTDSYKEIMSDVAKTCLKILGVTPCKFALVGMGSLARKEVTPYSDFECIIILEEGVQYKSNYKDVILEYFKWFAVIFQIILISLGETILPSVAILGLNDLSKKDGDWYYDHITPKGISFDGFMPYACKTPLGRQHFTKKKPWKTELIKPISEMLNYLSSEEDLKNGYHLADVLSATCFVFGEVSLHEEFSTKVISKRKMERQVKPDKYVQRFSQQIHEDAFKFDIGVAMGRLLIFDELKIKPFFYRNLTIFITALAKIHECTSLSSFDIVTELNRKRTILRDVEHKLKYAVAISCEARLKLYNFEKKQADEVTGSIYTIYDAVGEKCVVDYLTTTNCFQQSLYWYNPEIILQKVIFNEEAFILRKMIFVLYLHDQIYNFRCSTVGRMQSRWPNLVSFLVCYALDEEHEATQKLINWILHNYCGCLRFKQRGRYKLRKRNYNYIAATTIAKSIRHGVAKIQICRQLVQAVTWLWKEFCDNYDEKLGLDHILTLEPGFITTELDQPIYFLMKKARNFNLSHLKTEKCRMQFNSAWFISSLFKFYTALHQLILQWKNDIAIVRIKHKKLRTTNAKRSFTANATALQTD